MPRAAINSHASWARPPRFKEPAAWRKLLRKPQSEASKPRACIMSARRRPGLWRPGPSPLRLTKVLPRIL
eukprot:3799587-Pyramimonas_sp.AAC.2